MKRFFTALLLLFALSPAIAQNVSPGRLGVQPALDPEGVFILDKDKNWVTIGTMTGGVFTPVSGGGGTFEWPGTAGLGTAGAAAPNASTMPFVNSYLSGLLPAFGVTPTFNFGSLNGAATAANQDSTAAGTSSPNLQGVQGGAGGVPVRVRCPDDTTNCFSGGGGGGVATTPFIPGSTPIAPFNATVTSQTFSIPSGSKTLIISSSSATGNILHCTLGAGPAVGGDQKIEAGASFAFDVTSATQFSCMVSAGTQFVGAVAGSGALQAVAGTGPNITAPGSNASQVAGMQGVAGGIPFSVKPGAVTPLSPSCQLTFSTSAVQTSTCSGGIPAGATYALVCNEGAAARWRDDGSAPTISFGQILGTGSVTQPTCAGFVTTFSTLQWISEAGSAILDISWYK